MFINCFGDKTSTSTHLQWDSVIPLVTTDPHCRLLSSHSLYTNCMISDSGDCVHTFHLIFVPWRAISQSDACGKSPILPQSQLIPMWQRKHHDQEGRCFTQGGARLLQKSCYLRMGSDFYQWMSCELFSLEELFLQLHWSHSLKLLFPPVDVPECLSQSMAYNSHVMDLHKMMMISHISTKPSSWKRFFSLLQSSPWSLNAASQVHVMNKLTAGHFFRYMRRMCVYECVCFKNNLVVPAHAPLSASHRWIISIFRQGC